MPCPPAAVTISAVSSIVSGRPRVGVEVAAVVAPRFRELRPVQYTVAPASPSATAMPRPAPRVAPATSAIFPCNGFPGKTLSGDFFRDRAIFVRSAAHPSTKGYTRNKTVYSYARASWGATCCAPTKDGSSVVLLSEQIARMLEIPLVLPSLPDFPPGPTMLRRSCLLKQIELLVVHAGPHFIVLETCDRFRGV